MNIALFRGDLININVWRKDGEGLRSMDLKLRELWWIDRRLKWVDRFLLNEPLAKFRKEGKIFCGYDLFIQVKMCEDGPELFLFRGWYDGNYVKKSYKSIIRIPKSAYPEFRECVITMAQYEKIKNLPDCHHVSYKALIACEECHPIPRVDRF